MSGHLISAITGLVPHGEKWVKGNWKVMSIGVGPNG